MIDEKVVDYIKKSLSEGKTKEDLYKELLASGWTLETIEENFNVLKSEDKKQDIQKRTIGIIVVIGAVLQLPLCMICTAWLFRRSAPVYMVFLLRWLPG